MSSDNQAQNQLNVNQNKIEGKYSLLIKNFFDNPFSYKIIFFFLIFSKTFSYI